MNIKLALKSVWNGVNNYVFQPVIRRTGIFKNWFVRLFAKENPEHGLQVGGTESITQTPLHERNISVLVPQGVPEVRELSDKQIKKLDQWVKDAGFIAKRPDRQKAVDRIKQAISSGKRDISFSGLELGSLPKVLEEMPFITKLDCTGCCFRDAPIQFKKLPYLTELNLSGNYGVPSWIDSVNNFKQLRRLILDDCNFQKMPNHACFPKLTHLSLKDNSITEIGAVPAQLTHLNLDLNKIQKISPSFSVPGNTRCTINVDFNPVDVSELRRQLEELEAASRNVDGQAGTERGAVEFNCTGRVNYRTRKVENMPLDELIRHWFVLDNRPPPDGLNWENDETLRLLLASLAASADYSCRDRYQLLAHRICSLLEKMGSDEEINQQCFNTIQESTASCIDKAVLTLNELELSAQLIEAKRQGLEPLFRLGDAIYRKQLVDTKALQRVNQVDHHDRDDVETILAFEHGLADQFDLPITRGQKMLYLSFAHTQQHHLDQAATEIKATLDARTHEDRVNYFTGWTPWQEYLLQEFPDVASARDRINEEYSDKIDALNIDLSDPQNLPDDEAMGHYYQLLEEQKKAMNNLYEQETRKRLPQTRG